MNYVINYIKVLVIPICVFLILPLLLAIFNLLGLKTYLWMILSVMVVVSLISGFYIGRKTQRRGYVQGLIFGLVLVLFMLVLSLFGSAQLSFNSFLYYLIIIISTTVGSMLGIQKKASN